MKIIFKIGHFPIVSETFVVNQIISAINMGFEVKILVQKYLDNVREYDKIFEKYEINKKIIELDYEIPVSRTRRIFGAGWILLKNLRDVGPIIKYYRLKDKFSLSIVYEWFFFKRLRGTDIFHIHYGTNSKPIDQLRKSGYFKMPIVATFHGHDSFFPINGFIKKDGYYDYLFETADLITANTPYLKRQLLKIGCPEKKIDVVPMPIDCDFFSPKVHRPVDQEAVKLLSVGRLVPIKGHVFGILAINELIKKGYGVEYRIIGNGASKKELEDLAKTLGIQKNIIFLEELPQEEIRKFYYNSDIFLMPSSVVDGDTRETQGLVSLEAQACGLPVVGFMSGGIPYTIRHRKTGLIVEEGNYIKFAEAIEELIDNPLLLSAMASNGPIFIKKNFSTELISKFWERKYKDLILDSP